MQIYSRPHAIRKQYYILCKYREQEKRLQRAATAKSVSGT
jgi:hypothetical protein